MNSWIMSLLKGNVIPKKASVEKKEEDLKDKISSLKKKSGVWSLPFTVEKAEKLLSVIESLKEKDAETVSELQDLLYDIFGDDALFNDIDGEHSKIALNLSRIIKKHLRDMLKYYEKDPTTFTDKFDPKALEMLKNAKLEIKEDPKESSLNRKADYQGWTNYETWATKLWFDNDKATYDYIRDLIKDAKDEGEIADLLKDYVESGNPLLEEAASLYGDFLNSAISEVNFYEIAKEFLQERNDEETIKEPVEKKETSLDKESVDDKKKDKEKDKPTIKPPGRPPKSPSIVEPLKKRIIPKEKADIAAEASAELKLLLDDIKKVESKIEADEKLAREKAKEILRTRATTEAKDKLQKDVERLVAMLKSADEVVMINKEKIVALIENTKTEPILSESVKNKLKELRSKHKQIEREYEEKAGAQMEEMREIITQRLVEFPITEGDLKKNAFLQEFLNKIWNFLSGWMGKLHSFSSDIDKIALELQ